MSAYSTRMPESIGEHFFISPHPNTIYRVSSLFFESSMLFLVANAHVDASVMISSVYCMCKGVHKIVYYFLKGTFAMYSVQTRKTLFLLRGAAKTRVISFFVCSSNYVFLLLIEWATGTMLCASPTIICEIERRRY